MNIIKSIIHSLAKLRLKLYEYNFFKTYSFNIPVISIGNISMGGTGKTPMVAWIVDQLLFLNKKPCVITRGYNRKSNKMIMINNNKYNHYTLDEVGDEPFYLLKEYPNISMVVGNNKMAAINLAINKLDIDVIVLDDGFQSLYIKRDLDVVMININDCNIINRENFSALNRADVVIFKPCDRSLGDYYKKLNKMNNKKILKMVAKALFSIEDGHNVNNIKKIGATVAVCGIGDSASFKKSLINNNIMIGEFLSYGDHHNYTIDDMKFIYNKMKESNCQTIITTTKDFYKLNALNKKNKKIVVLKMKFDFLNTVEYGYAKKDELVTLLAATIGKYV